MRNPLAILALVFCLGIIVAGDFKIPFLLIYSLAGIFLILSFLAFRKGLRFDVCLVVLFFLLGIGALKNSQILPKCHISKYAYYKNNRLYTLKGFIVSEPVFKINKTSFLFRTQEISFDNFKTKACGDTLTYIKARRDLHYGDCLILSGSLYRPFKTVNLRPSSYRDYLANQGIYSIMNVSMPSRVIKLNYRKGSIVKRFALSLKSMIEGVIFKHLSGATASILNAMILGEKRNIPPLLYSSMVKSGTVHILVVSGFNVGIVFLIITLFLKLLRLPRRVRIYLAIPLLILYCLITGASNPVVRATVMAVIFLSSYLFKREPDIYNSLGIAGLFILGINPRQLFDVGFQLSFASVTSIVCFYPKIKLWLGTKSLKTRCLKFIVDTLLVSFSAWLGTMGFIAYYFRIISPITVLANLFIVPLATLITLCGFSFITIGQISPYLAPLFAGSCELLAALLIQINRFLIRIPGAYFYLSG